MAREASGEAGGIGQFIAIIALAVFARATLFTWCGQIGAPKVFDYSPILAPTLRVADGGPLYCDFRTTSLMPMLYGPIVPFVAAHLSHVFGHGAVAVLAAGRSITILSTLMVCALVFSLAQFTGASRLSSAIAALGFMISPLVQLWGFEFRADMPALAFNLAGVFAFETGLCPLAIVLFAGAFFAKQGQFYGIATIVLSLCIGRDFRRAATIGAAWAIVTGVVIAGMQCVTSWYWLNTFGALVGYYDISAPLSLLRHNIVLNAMLVLLGGSSLFRFGLNQMGCLFLLALAENSMDSLRWGSNFYYFLPTIAAAAILAPAPLDPLFCRAASRRDAFQVMCGVFVAITFSAGTVIDVVRNPSAPIAEAVRPVAVRDHC